MFHENFILKVYGIFLIYCTAQNFGRFGTARKLAEKILVADHTNNSSLLELTTFGG